MSTYISLPVLFELLVADFFSLTIKEEFLLEVFFLKLQKLLSTKVCDVEVELELLADSSFFEHEMIVRLKNNINEKFKTLFIFPLFSNERKR